MDNILITGATGFVGSEVVKQLLAQNLNIVASVRADNSRLPAGNKNWCQVLKIKNWCHIWSAPYCK